MPFYHYKSILGELYFDKNMNPVSRPRQKKAHILVPKEEKIKAIFQSLKNPRYYKQFRELNIQKSIDDLSHSLSADTFLVQSSGACEDLLKMLNIIHNRIKEWVGYLAPELVKKVGDTATLARLLHENTIAQALKKNNINSLLGTEQPPEAKKALKDLITHAVKLEKTLDKERVHLDALAELVIPNVVAICGATLGAKLLSRAGSLARMVRMPASTIQLLGAEAALFRHLKSKARPPKHGLLKEHPLLNKVDKSARGRAARDLANKICTAAKVDFFKGKFVGDQLRKELEKRFTRW